MNKKGEGIGFWGIFFVLVLFFGMRGCSQNQHQETINEFCISQGYEFGIESVEDTTISCKDYNNETTKEYDYKVLTHFREVRKR